jgi:hypothetical protein
LLVLSVVALTKTEFQSALCELLLFAFPLVVTQVGSASGDARLTSAVMPTSSSAPLPGADTGPAIAAEAHLDSLGVDCDLVPAAFANVMRQHLGGLADGKGDARPRATAA